MPVTSLRPLAIDADVVIESGGATAARVRSAGADIVVDVAPAATGALAAPLGGPLEAARGLARLSPSLRGAGLRLELQVGGRTVAVAGRGARRGRLVPLRGLNGVELRIPSLARAAVGGAFRDREVAEGEAMSRINKAKLLICIAAFASFLLSVYLWFVVDKEQGVFVGIWVPSILSLGAVLLAGRGKSS